VIKIAVQRIARNGLHACDPQALTVVVQAWLQRPGCAHPVGSIPVQQAGNLFRAGAKGPLIVAGHVDLQHKQQDAEQGRRRAQQQIPDGEQPEQRENRYQIKPGPAIRVQKSGEPVGREDLGQ
jgi:hypothetical protein